MRLISLAMKMDSDRLVCAVTRRTGPPWGRAAGESALTARIAGDERKGGGEYLRGGAVAGGKPYGAGSRKILFQQVEAAAVRTPEAVDGLVRVTDDKEFPPRLYSMP